MDLVLILKWVKTGESLHYIFHLSDYTFNGTIYELEPSQNRYFLGKFKDMANLIILILIDQTDVQKV